jgi:hypothetical protein
MLSRSTLALKCVPWKPPFPLLLSRAPASCSNARYFKKFEQRNLSTYKLRQVGSSVLLNTPRTEVNAFPKKQAVRRFLDVLHKLSSFPNGQQNDLQFGIALLNLRTMYLSLSYTEKRRLWEQRKFEFVV